LSWAKKSGAGDARSLKRIAQILSTGDPEVLRALQKHVLLFGQALSACAQFDPDRLTLGIWSIV